jgi:RNA polymerase sigma factor (sigma-70 family)
LLAPVFGDKLFCLYNLIRSEHPDKRHIERMELTDERGICQETVRCLLTTRGWRLIGISEDDLISATLDDLHSLRSQQNALDAKSIERCAARQYVSAFYRACQANGTAIQAEAFQALGERLVRIILHKMGDEEWAIECAQRALVKIFEKLDTCNDPRSFFSWTRTIVLNEYRQDVRNQERHPTESLDDAPESQDESFNGETSDQVAITQTPEDILADLEGDIAAQQLVRRIRQILGDSRYWQVVSEYYLKGRSYPEIAKLLQTNPNNVYLLMHRAIEKLRRDEQLIRDLQGFFNDKS